jgi:hypothetical protein
MLGAVLIILAAAPCPDAGTALVVETGAHRLTLCEAGVAHSTHRVAIGSGGVAIVNPDPKRFSAWAIGLHGPPRATKDEGDVNIDTDWTWGCIALRSDERIDEVAAWVREKKVTRVEFRE